MSRSRSTPGTRRKPATPKSTASSLVTSKLHETLIDVTGAVLVSALMAEKLTLAQAADAMGMPINRLRSDGMEFAMRFVAKLDPELGALMAAETPESEAAQVGNIAANARATAHVPGTMI